MNVRTKHWTLKPHRNMRQHKVFLRHELLKYNSEKSTAKSSALENYISSANLSLSGCSSAEPDSVSVGRCKFQLKKLYLQTVKKVDHLPPHPQRLFCRQRLGDEKKILRRTALPENGNGHQVSLLAAPAFIEQRFGCYLRDLDL